MGIVVGIKKWRFFYCYRCIWHCTIGTETKYVVGEKHQEKKVDACQKIGDFI